MPTGTASQSKPPRTTAARRTPASQTKPVRRVGKGTIVYAARLARVQQSLRETHGDANAVGCFLITNPTDVGYCTGFLGGDSYIVLPHEGSKGKPVIVSDFRYDEELQPLRAFCDIHIRKGGILDAVGAILAEHNATSCAFQADHLTVAEHEAFTAIARKGGCKLLPTKGLIARLRAVKDASEVALIRGAIKIQEAALKAILPTLKPGQSELSIAAALESEMKRRGSGTPAFETIIAARANGSLPHYRPGPVKTAANQPLLIDWGAVNQGYRGDMTRTFAFGKWPAKVAEIYDIVLEAHQRAAAGLKAGVSTREIDTLARGYIAQRGYGPQFGHGLGHGLGLNTHEGPRLHHLPAADEPLQAGMVVTIEPGIYLPGIGGVRIEDDYLVTNSGSENLSTLPKSRAWATL